jgi:hypothetical protein
VNSIKKTARIAGVLYLILAICSGFAFFVRSSLIVSEDATATANNIMASESLFRISFVSDLIGQIIFLFLVYFLYKLLKSVDKDQARLMVILVVASVPIACLNMINQFAVLPLLSGGGYLAAFNADQLHALAMLFLNLHAYGILIAQIFWGLWLLPLGYLVFKSGFIPIILGVLLIIAGLGYIMDSLGKFLISNYNITIASYTFIGEVLLLLWLLIKGVKDQQPAATKAI